MKSSLLLMPSSAAALAAARFLGVASVAVAVVSAAEEEEALPKSPSLTLEEFTEILDTEAAEEYGLSEELWQAAVAYEWQKALAVEHSAAIDGSTPTPYPYILCNHDESLRSGYQRKLAILEAVGSDNADPSDFRELFNVDGAFCALGHLLPSVAYNVEGDDLVVQPFMPSIKLTKDTVSSVQIEIANAIAGNNTAYQPSLDVLLCPNVLTTNSSTGVEEWSGEVTEHLKEKLRPSKLSENYYLTSTAYLNSSLASENGNITERARFWDSLLDEFQGSGKCDDTYSNRLTYSIAKANSSTALSLVQVNYNNTGDGELDIGCMLALTLALAALPTVCSVEALREVKPLNHEAAWVTQTGRKDQTPFYDVGLDGTGQMVAVSDTGIDMNNCYFWDFANPTTEVLNPKIRKVVQYRRSSLMNGDDYIYGHGTHVAGTVAGKRAIHGNVESDGLADGVAPGAKVAFYDIGGKGGGLWVGRNDELLGTGRPFVKIHSASWGAPVNLYTASNQYFDQYQFENDELLVVVAAGNDGDNNKAETIGSPASAKNVLTVGSHHNGGSSGPYRSPGIDYVSGFSSRGPTVDKRTKPDVLAPGEFVLSACARPDLVGECDPADGSVPPVGGAKDGLLSLQGTSMSTPATAGTAAIIRHYFAEGYYPTGKKTASNKITNPTSALIKAVIMNGAQFMSGVANDLLGITPVEPYDNTQNFGRVSLEDSLYLEGKTDGQLRVFDRQTVLDKTTKTYTMTIDKSRGCTSPNFSVTLVWTEQGSFPGCTWCLLNDLDLTVSHSGDTYLPNGRDFPDRANNAERVIVENVSDEDVFEVKVTAHNIVGTSQKYALVATGCFGGIGSLSQGNDKRVVVQQSTCARSQRMNPAIFVGGLLMGILFIAP